MPNLTEGIGALITGGVGATLGSIVTALLQVTSKRRESRAAAADLVTSAAERMLDRYSEENEHMREAIILITDVLDELIPTVCDDGVRDRLKKANRAAKRALR